ncbi:hypothetical protein [Leptothermofonsia sp. ETS-13]|uniref:hypothetical protein n=1 Tax=Leptothermofonsia sp. ETS-13 TaxID=3035696 RepID=UPI003B9E1523
MPKGAEAIAIVMNDVDDCSQRISARNHFTEKMCHRPLNNCDASMNGFQNGY